MKAIDLFAGWGGFTQGAEQAGVEVVYAANHWPLAVQAHQMNHPSAKHECQDLRQANWSRLPDYDLLLAAPCCQGHSNASQPKRRAYHDDMRATAWAVVGCADATLPKALVVENVPQFLDWSLFPHWKASLETLGYHLQIRKLTASYYGTPQRRQRVFIIGTRKKADIELAPSKEEMAFGPCIDWDLGSGAWKPIRQASDNVKKRIAKGRKNHGERFLTQHVTGHPGVSLFDPIRTITTKDQWAVVDGDYYRPLSIRENARGMGFPDSYSWPESTRTEQITGLGNAICPPLAKRLVEEVSAAV